MCMVQLHMHGDQLLTSFVSVRQISKGLVYRKYYCAGTGMLVACLLEVQLSDYGKKRKKKTPLRYAMSVGY